MAAGSHIGQVEVEDDAVQVVLCGRRWMVLLDESRSRMEAWRMLDAEVQRRKGLFLMGSCHGCQEVRTIFDHPAHKTHFVEEMKRTDPALGIETLVAMSVYVEAIVADQ